MADRLGLGALTARRTPVAGGSMAEAGGVRNAAFRTSQVGREEGTGRHRQARSAVLTNNRFRAAGCKQIPSPLFNQ